MVKELPWNFGGLLRHQKIKNHTRFFPIRKKADGEAIGDALGLTKHQLRHVVYPCSIYGFFKQLERQKLVSTNGATGKVIGKQRKYLPRKKEPADLPSDPPIQWEDRQNKIRGLVI